MPKAVVKSRQGNCPQCIRQAPSMTMDWSSGKKPRAPVLRVQNQAKSNKQATPDRYVSRLWPGLFKGLAVRSRWPHRVRAATDLPWARAV